MEKFMDIKQTLEWIAFRKNSKLSAEYIISHMNEILKAAYTLKLAIENSLLKTYDPKTKQQTYLCGINKIDYQYNMILSDTGDCFGDHIVFNEMEIIANFPSSQTQLSQHSSDNGYTTPYIEFMLNMIKEENISDANQPKKEFLASKFISEAQKSGFELSNRLADAMATMIRLPESQKGKAKKGCTH